MHSRGVRLSKLVVSQLLLIIAYEISQLVDYGCVPTVLQNCATTTNRACNLKKMQPIFGELVTDLSAYKVTILIFRALKQYLFHTRCFL